MTHTLDEAGARDMTGWVITCGNRKRFRTWTSGMSEWTDDPSEATRYARRQDAEAVHREDEDAFGVFLLVDVLESCPGCRSPLAEYRTEKRTCGWCGIDLATGKPGGFVVAASQAEPKAVGEDVVERVAHDEMPPHLYARALEIVDEWEFEGSLTPTELVERLYRCFTRPPSPDTVTMLGDGPDER